LEVEVGLVLGKDVGSSAELSAAIDHYFTGVEICGTRYVDRSVAGPMGGLADSQSAFGYVMGPDRAAKDQIDELEVELRFGGTQIYKAAAKHSFGTVLSSLMAYADSQHASYPLRAGTIVTTGSLCGLVPTHGPAHVIARLGDQTVEFDLV
jgi:2-keto-4-pentenoate hydratase